jgi:hypothetical protein
MEQRETFSEQPEDSLVDSGIAVSTEVALKQDIESDQESQSGCSSDSETSFDKGKRVKVGAAAALTGISYDFGLLTVARTRIGSLESYNCYFPKGHGRPLGSESVSNPRLVEAMVFEDFFAAGVCMPPHSILVDILRKFWV